MPTQGPEKAAHVYIPYLVDAGETGTTNTGVRQSKVVKVLG